MAARAATFVVRRGDIPKLAAAGASRPAFKQALAECMVEQPLWTAMQAALSGSATPQAALTTAQTAAATK
ncbi:hypothetical protein [Rhizocola hellebori]|nr:hypothetical protein [Rhizocola hellebori]